MADPPETKFLRPAAQPHAAHPPESAIDLAVEVRKRR